MEGSLNSPRPSESPRMLFDRASLLAQHGISTSNSSGQQLQYHQQQQQPLQQPGTHSHLPPMALFPILGTAPIMHQVPVGAATAAAAAAADNPAGALAALQMQLQLQQQQHQQQQQQQALVAA